MDEQKPLSKEEKEVAQLERHLDVLHSLRGIDGDEVKGYVYREVMGGTNASLPPVDRVLMDHELGELYGPGKYRVTYIIWHGTEQTRKTERYNIGREFANVHRQYCSENGVQCYLDSNTMLPGERRPQMGISDFLGSGKAQEVLALVAGLKQILGNGQNDQKELLIEMIRSQNRPQAGMGETIVAKALEMMGSPKQNNSPASILGEQLDIFQKMQSTFLPPAAEKDSEPMSFWEKGIEMAMGAIPQILAQNNGNIEQAAKALKQQNASLRIALGMPTVQKAAYKELAGKYGQAQADRWAVGFGLNPVNLRGEVKTEQSNAKQPQKMVFG
jgi:hypothetical protein